jgi:hypothetical protein
MTDLVARLRDAAGKNYDPLIVISASDIAQRNTDIELLITALSAISRMSGHPDKIVCLATISSAKRIAEDALRDHGGKKEGTVIFGHENISYAVRHNEDSDD